MSHSLSKLFGFSYPVGKSIRKRDKRVPLSLEPLEARYLMDMNPLLVTVAFDDSNGPIPGVVTLRDAIGYADAHPGSAVSFQSNVTGVIGLGAALPTITANMIIDGPGSSTLGVSAANAPNPCGILTINSGVTATIDGLQIGGNNVSYSGDGGAILNKGNLTLCGDLISNAVTTGSGGGIFNSGAGATLSLSGCQVNNNKAAMGGGIYNLAGKVTINGGYGVQRQPCYSCWRCNR